jgi:uncharacterized protein YlxW (UPF0749 family)
MRPGAGGGRRPAWRYGVPVTLLFAGLLFAAGADNARVELGGSRQEELSGLVAQQNRKVEAYSRQVQQLQRDVDRASRTRARDDQVAQRSQRAADRLRGSVGLRAVTGNAIRVTLNDAPRSASADTGNVPPDYLVVHQQDVQAVVNAMWAGGASAVQVMDQRLIATSAVRCVGNTLLLNGRVYSPPFTVTAIGPTDQLTTSLYREPGVRIYQQYVRTYNLGFKVERLGKTTIPAYEGTLDLQYARRAGG